MKKNSVPITRSDLVDLLGKINASLDEKLDIREKRLEAKIKSGQKEIIRRLDRMEKRNGHVRNQIKKAGKNLSEV